MKDHLHSAAVVFFLLFFFFKRQLEVSEEPLYFARKTIRPSPTTSRGNRTSAEINVRI